MPESAVKEIMTEFVQTIPSGSTVVEAAQMMTKGGIGCIVVTEKGNPIGMLTERDVMTKVTSQDLNPSKVLVEKIMSSPIVTIDPGEIIDEAALMMSIYGIRRLVVVGKGGTLSGIITTTDIASWISRNKDYKSNALNAIVKRHDTEQSMPYH